MENLKNRFLTSFILVVCCFIFAGLTLLVLPPSVLNKKVFAANEDIKISIEAANYDSASQLAMPNSQNNVAFYIKASSLPSAGNTITVYYRTRDITAVARNGDYEAVNSTCTINSNTATQNDGSVKVGFAVKVNARNYNVVFDNANHTNKFLIEIYKIEGNASVESGKESLFCACRTSMSYDATSNGTYHFFNDYDILRQYYMRDQPVGKDGDGWLIYNTIGMFYDKDVVLYDKYIKTLFAKPYASGYGKIDEDSWFEGWGANAQMRLQADSASEKRKEILYLSFDGGFDNTKFRFGDYKSDDDIEEHDFYTKSITYSKLPSEYGKLKEMWCVQWDYETLNKYFYVNLHSNCGVRKFKDWTFGVLLYDDKRPEIVSAYADQTQGLTKDDKFYMQLKFSEPVQITNPHSIKLTALIGQRPVEFSYFDGSGSDTLCFAMDLSSLTYNGVINAFTLSKLVGSSYISDFSLGNNSFGNFASDGSLTTEYSARIPCSLDVRTPIIGDTTVSTSVQKSFSVGVFTEEVENGKLYYSWTKSDVTPAVYDSVIENVGVQRIALNGEKYNGLYYLHIKLISNFEKQATKCFGPYKFDNMAPEVNVLYDTASTLKAKRFTINCVDGPGECPSGLNKIYMVIKDVSTRAITLDSNNEFVLTTEGAGYAEGEYGIRQIAFYATDNLENMPDLDTLNYQTYRFDTRNIFESEITSQNEVLYNENAQIGVLLDENEQAVFTITNKDELNEQLVFVSLIDADEVDVDSTLYQISYSENNEQASAEEKFVTLTMNSPVAAGAYRVLIKTTPGDQIAEYYFVVGYGNEDTQNFLTIQSNQTLINKVYQLGSEYSSLYYLDALDTIGTEKYGNSRSNASFSSKEKAFQYALFREYEDIWAVTLTQDQADWLNSGSVNGYMKASGEDQYAQPGQVWIRYKMKSWTNASKENAWHYYYYGPSSVDTNIKTTTFSANLQDALQTVANTICESGSYVYLITGNGIPTLEAGQMHYAPEAITTTKCQSQFENEISWFGDEKIYSSYADLSGKEYKICADSTLILDNYSKLFYKKQNTQNPQYTEIPITFNGVNLKSILSTSGVYTFCDIDKNGIRIFDVYIDYDAPELNFSLSMVDGTIWSSVLTDTSAGRVFYGSKASINNISLEIDDYCYVAIYKYYRASSNVLLNVYRQEDFQSSSVILENGEFEVKIGDRSGNCYSFFVFVNDEELDVAVTQVGNSYILVNCNRQSDQIDFYEVYLNEKLIANTYTASAKYTEGGVYRIFIQDIYGGIFSETVEFTRQYPLVTWKYLKDNSFIVFEESQTQDEIVPMSLTQTETTQYLLVTNTSLQFVLPADYNFEFDGFVPTYSQNLVTGTVTFAGNGTNLENFVLKVFYSAYPEIFVVYYVSVDADAPIISASLQTNSYNLKFVDEFVAQLAEKSVGDVLIPSTIAYGLESGSTYSINADQTVSADLIYLNFSDNTSVATVDIFVDNVLYTSLKQTLTTVVSKYGTYRIVAKDRYGNQSEFAFINQKFNEVELFVDSVSQTIDESCINNFDENGNYTKVQYGNQSVEYKINTQGYAYFFVTVAEQKHFFILKIENEKISQVEVVVVEEENEKTFAYSLKQGTEMDLSDNLRHPYQIVQGLSTFVKHNADGSISVIASALENENDEVLIETNIQQNSKFEPKYFKISLSKKAPSISILDQENEPIEVFGERLKINGNFKIDTNLEETIKFISVQFSPVGDFDNAENIYEAGKIFADEGIYKISVINVYEIEKTFEIMLSNSFVVVAMIEHEDGTKIDAQQGDTLFSNFKINFVAYSAGATYVVTKNGDTIEVEPISSTETTSLTISGDGVYSVTVFDGFGNEQSFSAEIKNIDLEFDEELLYGFNAKAQSGYTNKKVSVNGQKLLNYAYLEIGFGEEKSVIYDKITNRQIEPQSLFEIIGLNGDGDYVVAAKDKYGNICSKVVHFQETPTLQISRTLRNSALKQSYSIERAVEIGAWANNSLMFETTSSNYVFKLDGGVSHCPLVLAYNATNYDLNFIHTIYYLDEFGFEYEFDAHLVRKAISIAPNNMQTKIVNGVITTQDAVSVVVSDNVETTYSLNGGPEMAYESMQKLYGDGAYRFIATDYAGNTTTYSVKRDTIVECQFEETKANRILLNGGVASTNRVVFRNLNGDSAVLSKVFLDGEKVDFTGNSFEEAGFWQVVATDAIGNEKYFEFYILTHAVSSFAYTTPYEYKISEVWFTSVYGSVISYLNFVNQNENTSDFDFFEDGSYTIIMQSMSTGDVDEFSFTLDTTPPSVALVGCTEGETTKEDVTISGCKVGDKVYVYRNGTLLKTLNVTSNETPMPVISEGGDYTIVVESVSGVKTQMSFSRRHMLNVAASAIIIVVTLVVVIVMLFGLVLRNKEKSDI